MSLGSPGDTEEARYTAVMERLQYDSLEFASESRHRTDSYPPHIFAFTISQLNVYINLEFLIDYFNNRFSVYNNFFNLKKYFQARVTPS